MEFRSDEVVTDFYPFFKIYKDGHVERFIYVDYQPPVYDPETKVESSDIVISNETGVKARLYVPKIIDPGRKLPVLIHYHAGGFCIGSPFDVICSAFVRTVVSQANAIGLSIDYRLGPEHLLPIGYDDSWAIVEWLETHSNGLGPIPVLNEKTDMGRVFLIGESAGGTIAHNVAIQAGVTPLSGLRPLGLILVHPFFIGDEIHPMYKFLCPSSSGGKDDPRINPGIDPNLKTMGCDKVLVFVAGADEMRERGVNYCEALRKCGWRGNLEMFETEGEDHVFHMFNPTCEKAKVLMKRLTSFLNEP